MTDHPVSHTIVDKRLHGLDALRAVAMMLGVWLHAGMAYIAGLPPFFWAVDDPDKSPLIAHSITLIHAWRMETFFLLSGFFTAMLVSKRGVLKTARQRALRIGLPFLLAVLLIQPLCVIVWAAGYSAQYGFPIENAIKSVFKASWGIEQPGVPARMVSLWHLWFLYVLLYFVTAGLLIYAVIPQGIRGGLDRFGVFLTRVAGSWWGAIALAVPVGSCLLLHSPAGASPNMTLVPQWGTLAYYALPFAFGWLVYPAREQLGALARRWWIPMLFGIIAFVVYRFAVHRGALGFDPGRGVYLAAIGSHGLMTTGFSLGMIGLFMRVLASPGPRLERWVRYGSDMAYWVYLAHLPLVVWFGVLLVDWRIHGLIKMAIVVSVGMLLLILSYQLLVRHTPIGWLLNGRRGQKTPPEPRNPPDSLEQTAVLGDS